MKNMLTVSTFAILALLAAPVHAAPDQSDMDPSAKIAGEAMDHGDHCGMPTAALPARLVEALAEFVRREPR